MEPQEIGSRIARRGFKANLHAMLMFAHAKIRSSPTRKVQNVRGV
jgi:hypothetical protein